jgi:hypothetical protein
MKTPLRSAKENIGFSPADFAAVPTGLLRDLQTQPLT